MSIEQYFHSSSMTWFKETKNSRYSPYHWNEIKLQTLEACTAVRERCLGRPNATIGVVGFGFGRETELLFKEDIGTKIVGLDINHSRFEETKKIRPNLFDNQLYPVAASMNNTPFIDNSFDAVLCLETMMHSDSPYETLKELTRITKPDGLIIFNMSTSLGTVNNLVQMLRVEGLPRIIDRFRERIVRDKNSSSVRTKLYNHDQINDFICKNTQTKLEATKSYLGGLSTYVVLKKLI